MVKADTATIFMPPAEAGAAPVPAPFLLTEEEVARFLRLESTNAYHALRRYRQKEWLRGVQVGNAVRYRLVDVLEFLETAQKENPR